MPSHDHLFMVRPHLENVPEAATPAGFLLRSYQSGDEREWLEIVRSAYGDVWGDNAFDRCTRSDETFRPERLFFVALGARLVGAVGAFQKLIHGDRTGYVHMLAVRPDFRRRGLGSALLRRCLRSFREAGWKDAVLDTDTRHPEAVRLYLSHGFLPFPETQTELAVWANLLPSLGWERLAGELRLRALPGDGRSRRSP